MVPNRMLPLFLLFEIICMQFELNNLVAVCCLINVLNNNIVAATLRRRQRRRARRRNGPIMWKLPRPRDSWFEIHFYDRTLDERFFRKQLRMNRTTFVWQEVRKNRNFSLTPVMKTKESNADKKTESLRGRTAAPLINLSESNYFVLAGQTIRTEKSYVLTDFLAKTNRFVLSADRP